MKGLKKRLNRWRRVDDVCVVVTWVVTRRALSHRWAQKQAGARGEGTKQMNRETVSSSKDSLACLNKGDNR